LGFDYCLALRSPAIALHLALTALALEEGQGVLVSALSPRYYLPVLEELRLRPVFADVLPQQAVLGRDPVEAALKAAREAGVEVRALAVHHTLGFVPDLAPLLELGIPVIEDCSQSYGTAPASPEEASPGEGETREAVEARGVLVILGLEERDMLTSGGGALLYAMNRRDASALRNYGPGGVGDLPPEYCLPDMNAALAMVQFREAARNLEKRREIARAYGQSSQRTRHKRFIQRADWEYNNYAFPLILETGVKDVKTYARRKDIAVESAFEDTLMGRGLVSPGSCPESYSLSLRTVLFPLYPRLASAEAGKVAKLILTLP
jgi:dTDP-4-amino-4,6-dideoxygalactose transaminase